MKENLKPNEIKPLFSSLNETLFGASHFTIHFFEKMSNYSWHRCENHSKQSPVFDVVENVSTKVSAEEFSSREFWQKINPQLHISNEKQKQSPFPPFDFDSDALGELSDCLKADGYFFVDQKHLPYSFCLDCVAVGVYNLQKHGLHPLHILVYDEVCLNFPKKMEN